MKRILSLGFLFGMLAFALIPNAYASWDIEELDFGPHFAEWNPEHAMVFSTGSGNVYVAYGGNHLYVARYNNGTSLWEDPVLVDSAPNVGRYTSCAYNAATGTVHVSYYDEENGDLKHAYYVEGPTFLSTDWTVETLDSDDNVGLYTAIEVGLHPTGPPAPRISYYDATNHQLKFIYYDSTPAVHWPGKTRSSWTRTETSGNTRPWQSIPTNGNIHISYYDETNYDLKYAWTDDLPSFSELDPGSCRQFGQRRREVFLDLALNPPSRLPSSHLLFRRYEQQYLCMYSEVGVPSVPATSWQTPAIMDSDVDVGRYCSLRVEAPGLPISVTTTQQTTN